MSAFRCCRANHAEQCRLLADFVAEIGDHNSEAADRDFLRRSLPYAPLGAGFDAVAPTPAAVTQHAQWLVLVVVGRPVWRAVVGFVRLRRA
jgi:hypothetical protein